MGCCPGEGVVAAERHYDPMRAQLTAASAVGGATALISLGLAPLLGLQAPGPLSVESAFWSFLVAASAGGCCWHVALLMLTCMSGVAADQPRMQAAQMATRRIDACADDTVLIGRPCSQPSACLVALVRGGQPAAAGAGAGGQIRLHGPGASPHRR